MRSNAWLYRAILVVSSGLLSSCLSFGPLGISHYDSRPLSVAYLSLFNQRQASQLSDYAWKGDWLFRRERLLFIDGYFAQKKPDLLVLQELLERRGGQAESDQVLLGQGSLAGYQWDLAEVQRYEDTQELEYHAVAGVLPLRVTPLVKDFKRSWDFEDQSRMQFFLADFEGQEVPIFSVELAQQGQQHQQTLSKMAAIIKLVTYEYNFCPRRVLVAGSFPMDFSSNGLEGFMEELELVDIASGSCDVASDCYTATPRNEVFLATAKDQTPRYQDYIMVHKATVIGFPQLIFNEAFRNGFLEQRYNMKGVWPTQRFGWSVNVRLNRCLGSKK